MSYPSSFPAKADSVNLAIGTDAVVSTIILIVRTIILVMMGRITLRLIDYMRYEQLRNSMRSMQLDESAFTRFIAL